MSAAAFTLSTPAPGVLALSGALVFATAAQALAQARQALARGEIGALDLGSVDAADSAGLAVLLALRRTARAQGVDLELRGLPRSLRALAQLGEVEALLGIATKDFNSN